MAAGGELKLQSQPMIGSNFSFTMVVKPVKPPEKVNSVPSIDVDSTKLPALPGIVKPIENVSRIVPSRQSNNKVKTLLLNYENISINADPHDIDSDSIIDEEEVKLQRTTSQEDLERGKLAARELIFFVDDFYICHQAIQL